MKATPSPLLAALAPFLAMAAVATAHPDHSATPAGNPLPPAFVVEFSDFDSAPCAEVEGLLEELADSRGLALERVFKHAPGSAASLAAHEAALAAGDQGRFWDMHHRLFERGGRSKSSLLAVAAELGLDAAAFEAALDSRVHRDAVMRDLSEARALGVQTLPTLFINGTKIEGVEALRALVHPPAPAPPAAPSIGYDDIDLGSAAAAGPADAPVTIVEFSDFRCGFCGVNARALDEVAAAYPGKVRRLFKHFPISMDSDGFRPHLAAIAAMRQGKFWEMHEALMASPLRDEADLLARAGQVGLDLDRLRRDMADPAAMAMLRRDIADGDGLAIRATPTTYINGEQLVGRHTPEALRERIEAILGGAATVRAAAQPAGPEIHPAAFASGPADASARVEFYVDLGELQATAAFAQTLKAFRRERQDVRIELRHAPSGPAALKAHGALVAAAAQGQLWPMLDRILAEPAVPAEPALRLMAKQAGLDLARFSADLGAPRSGGLVAADTAAARARGATGPGPAIFLNDTRHEGEPSVASLAQLMDENVCCGKPPLLAGDAADYPVNRWE